MMSLIFPLNSISSFRFNFRWSYSRCFLGFLSLIWIGNWKQNHVLTKHSSSSCWRICLQAFRHAGLLGLYFVMLSEYLLGSSMKSPWVRDSVYVYFTIASLVTSLVTLLVASLAVYVLGCFLFFLGCSVCMLYAVLDCSVCSCILFACYTLLLDELPHVVVVVVLVYFLV